MSIADLKIMVNSKLPGQEGFAPIDGQIAALEAQIAELSAVQSTLLKCVKHPFLPKKLTKLAPNYSQSVSLSADTPKTIEVLHVQGAGELYAVNFQSKVVAPSSQISIAGSFFRVLVDNQVCCAIPLNRFLNGSSGYDYWTFYSGVFYRQGLVGKNINEWTTFLNQMITAYGSSISPIQERLLFHSSLRIELVLVANSNTTVTAMCSTSSGVFLDLEI